MKKRLLLIVISISIIFSSILFGCVKDQTETPSNPTNEPEIPKIKYDISGTSYEIEVSPKAPEGGILGFDGYLIRSNGNKLSVLAGSETSKAAAQRYLESLLDENGELYLIENYSYSYHPFMDFLGCEANGEPLSSFQIVYDSSNSLESNAAYYLKQYIFQHTGEYLTDNESTFKIVFNILPDDNNFGKVRVDDALITISGSSKVGLYRVMRDMFKGFAETNKGEKLKLACESEFEKDYGTFITYEDYGAVGDGVKDDNKAIQAAHKAADEKNYPILTKEDATYYIKGTKTSKITTDVDWSTSHFIIDDKNCQGISAYVFSVPTEYKEVSLKKQVSSLPNGSTNLGVELPSESIVKLTNTKVKQYIRKGANQDSGQAMCEILLVDKNGNISVDTPIVWDFTNISSISYKQIENTERNIVGGIFTTIANNGKSEYTYYNRGFEITRSNTKISDIQHYVIEEGSSGSPYSGFLMISNTYNVILEDSIVTPHKTYTTIGSAGVPVQMGTYESQVSYSLGAVWNNVIQSRDVTDNTYWGSFASNYSKNITMNNCILGRFDAHCGVYNATLVGCTFGHQSINLIGHGTAKVIGCTLLGKYIINLRDDYGATWNGDLLIKDCLYIPKNGNGGTPILINGVNDYDHDFGYECYLPKNIEIENLTIDDSNGDGTGPYLFAVFNSKLLNDASYVGKYPMVMPESIIVKNLTVKSGKTLLVSLNENMFKGVEIKLENN